MQQQKESLLQQENHLLQCLQTHSQEKEHLLKLRTETLEEIRHLSDWVREQKSHVSKAAQESQAAADECDRLMNTWQMARRQATQAHQCQPLAGSDSSDDDEMMFEACMVMEQQLAVAARNRQIAAAETEGKRLSSEAGLFTETAEERQVKNLKTAAGTAGERLVTSCSPSRNCQSDSWDNLFASADVNPHVAFMEEVVSWKLLPSVGTWLQANAFPGR